VDSYGAFLVTILKIEIFYTFVLFYNHVFIRSAFSGAWRLLPGKSE